MRLIVVLALLVAALPATAFAKGRVVDCRISAPDGTQVQFKGRCKFVPEPGGSFSLSDANGKAKFYSTISIVSVYLTGKDTAEVSGLVLDPGGGGHNSRWGEATRSTKDRACWDGSDFQICAW